MFETIVAIVLLVVIPYLFHQFITKRYYKIDKELFDELGNVGSEGEQK